MARRRTKPVAEIVEAQAEQSTPVQPEAPETRERDIFDQVISARKAAEVQPEASAPPAEPVTAGRSFARGFIANPSSKRRDSHAEAVAKKLPSTLSVSAGDMRVHLVDKGDNSAGIGIRVEFLDGRKPTNDEKEIIRRHIKGEEGEQTGFNWIPDFGMWHKEIVRSGEYPNEVPPSRPVAIRLDAENRVEKLAEALRQHAADPVSYAEMVKQRREQAAESGRIPD